jgi:hypothetical protein
VDAILSGSEIQIGAVELDDAESDTRAAIRQDASAFPAAATDFGGILIAGRDDTGNVLRHVRVDPSGRILAVVTPAPGGTVAVSGNLAVPAGPATPVPAGPVGTTRANFQNVGAPGDILCVRELGGVATTGRFLLRYGSTEYTRYGGPFEVEVIAGGPGSLNYDYEV